MLRTRMSKQIIEDDLFMIGKKKGNIPSMSPLSGRESEEELPKKKERKPTLKTGRGYGKKKKQNFTIGFKLIEGFREHSYQVENKYDAETH